MIICHDPRFAFVHIPKTGGTSVALCLHRAFEHQAEKYWRQHYTYDRICETYPYVAEYFSFVFVRNPWDRIVSILSAYYRIALTPESFPSLLSKGLPNPTRWRPFEQVKFVYDDTGKQLVSFIGRYENLAKDFETVSDKLGVELVLPHVNNSQHSDYHDYYDDETRQIIADRFARDIETFGYTF